MPANGRRLSGASETTQRDASASDSARRRTALWITWVVGSAPAFHTVLSRPRLGIGRNDDCQIRLEHASVSRRHAELQRQGPIYAVKDCGSTNGVRVNGKRVEHGAIGPGDVLRLGDGVGVVCEVADGAAPDFRLLAPGLWGGPAMAAAFERAAAAAPSAIPIVIVGESGVGKEHVAGAVHQLSGRAGRYHGINCSTLPVQLAEAELFGHHPGAFTGAGRGREGHFQAAHRGTLFLDEIAELPLEIQAKLLRAVEAQEVVPLGGTRAVPVEVRLIAAAQQPLETLVARGAFRADLQARLTGLVVKVPPLRRRRDEIPGFVAHFLQEQAGGSAPRVAPALLEWLCLYDWPGNVRELAFMVKRLLAVHGGEPVLRLSHARELDSVPEAEGDASGPIATGFRDRRAADLHRLNAALERTGGNLKAAAEAIGISRRRAYRLLDAAKSAPAKPDRPGG